MPTQTSLTDADKEFLKKQKAVLIPKADLLPPAQKGYDSLKRDFPIVLQIGVQRHAQILALPSGMQVVVVGENDHRWTREYVTQHPEVLGNNDADLKNMPRLSNPDILKAIQQFAKGSGVVQVPTAVINSESSLPPALASAGVVQSSAGKYYILVDQSIANDPKRTNPQIAHEFGHIANRDMDPAQRIAKHNDTTKTIARNNELRADQHSVKLCQGDASADTMEEALRFFKAQGMQVPPSPEGHPSPDERIPLLRAGAQAERKAGRCK